MYMLYAYITHYIHINNTLYTFYIHILHTLCIHSRREYVIMARLTPTYCTWTQTNNAPLPNGTKR